MTANDAFTWICAVILIIFGGYLGFRIFSKAIFCSWWEAKKQFNEKSKEKIDG